MAIQFNPNALGAFSNVDFGRDDAIANLGENNGLEQNGTRGLGIFAKIRFSSTKANNNAVRTELLKALGQTFNLNGVGEHDGKTTFSHAFMDKLEDILGPAFKREDFGIDANGVVTSGKPLTQRRIQAVCSAATDYATRTGLNRDFENAVALLTGKAIGEIVGDNRGEGWEAKVDNLAVLAAKVNHAALSMTEVGDTATVVQGDVKVELTWTDGGITASLTNDDVTRQISDFATTREELCIAMDSTVASLYDSFTEKKDGDLTYGRSALANKVLPFYKELSQNNMDTTEVCPLRNFASALLMTKAKVSESQIDRLTNQQLAEFVEVLCNTGDGPAVKDSIVLTISTADAEERKLEEAANELQRQQDGEYEYGMDDEVDDNNDEVNESKVEGEPQPPVNGGQVFEDINAIDPDTEANKLPPGVIDINAI